MDEVMMKIHLLVDGEKYPMTIKRNREQIYRDAAKECNTFINRYRDKFPTLPKEKLLSMVALDLAHRMLVANKRTDAQPLVEKLEKWTTEIEGYITTEETRK
ncbi:MAG: cell division protein ZapA [Bacteroidales bacterium]|nr:cell division protein ZapA [Bacteroidales bacterium]